MLVGNWREKFLKSPTVTRWRRARGSPGSSRSAGFNADSVPQRCKFGFPITQRWNLKLFEAEGGQSKFGHPPPPAAVWAFPKYSRLRVQRWSSAFLRFGSSPGSFIIASQSRTTSYPSRLFETLPPRCGSAPNRPPWWRADPCSRACGPRRRTRARRSLGIRGACWSGPRTWRLSRRPGAEGWNAASWKISSNKMSPFTWFKRWRYTLKHNVWNVHISKFTFSVMLLNRTVGFINLRVLKKQINTEKSKRLFKSAWISSL